MGRSRWSCAALAAIAAALVCAPAIEALPGDAPIVLLSPGDGASVPADPDGVPVTFSCPDYHPSAQDPELVYTWSQYRVRFDESPTLGADGLLGDGYSSPSAENDGGPNCSARLNALGSGPEATGGRVYWQVFRPLSHGAGYEASPVWSFVVVPEAIKAALKVRGRIWGGYKGLYNVKAEAFIPDATIALQRRAGRKWRTFAARGLDPEATDLVGVLPTGRQTIRVRIETVTSTFTAATRAVKVRKATRAARGSGRDGEYAGRRPSERADQRFVASDRGRRIERFFARFRTFCLPDQVMATTIAFKRLKVAPDGSVVGHRQSSNEFELVTGRLTKGRFRGRVELQSPQCHGAERLDLER
jgi:hypothetical protein